MQVWQAQLVSCYRFAVVMYMPGPQISNQLALGPLYLLLIYVYLHLNNGLPF